MMTRLLFPLSVLVCSTLMSGCGERGQGTGAKAGRVKIGFLVKMPEEAWFQNEWKFARQAADRFGFDLVTIGAPDGEKVLAAIDNLAAQGAQGFVICTPDVRLGPAIMTRARSHGMKVLSVDDQFVGPDGKFMDVPYLGISATAIGQAVGKALWTEMRRRGWSVDQTGVCAVTYDELETCRQRTDGAAQALTAAGMPSERIFHTAAKTTDIPGAFDAANVLLTRQPQVRRWLVYSYNDEGVLGAVRALEGRGFMDDNVIGIGIGGSNIEVEFRKPKPTGFFGTWLLEIKRHGFETAESMYKWIKDGVEPPKTSYTLGTLITRENYRTIMRQQGLLGD
jgi:L-arabinose transport system substrate-binding protein